MMPNCYPECQNFQSAPHNHYRFFFLHTLPLPIVFKLQNVLSILRKTKISTFSIKKCSVRLLSLDALTSCMRLSYTPWSKTEISRTVENREKLVGYARNLQLAPHLFD